MASYLLNLNRAARNVAARGRSLVEESKDSKEGIQHINSASGLSTKELRSKIREVQTNPNLDAAEKAKQVQILMTTSWRRSQEKNKSKIDRSNSDTFSVCSGEWEEEELETRSASGASEGAASDSETGMEVEALASPRRRARSYHNEVQGVYGCKHYMRNCLIKAPCCPRFFPCRFCHDEHPDSDHAIDRYAVDQVKCMECGTEQPVGANCVKCGLQFAKYFCEPCRFYDDHPNKNIYHCPHCNICRIGQGLGIDYFHCHKCNACMSITLKDHKCVERSLESDCPVCHEFMFTSTTPVMFLPCGHCMHVTCYERYTATNYVCPICSKSLGNMSAYFSRIDEMLKHESMPKEYEGVRSKVFCADCEKRSIAKFHFLYHKCFHCSSYNTKVLDQIARDATDPLEQQQEILKLQMAQQAQNQECNGQGCCGHDHEQASVDTGNNNETATEQDGASMDLS